MLLENYKLIRNKSLAFSTETKNQQPLNNVEYCDAAWFETEDFWDVNLELNPMQTTKSMRTSENNGQKIGFQTASNKTIKISEKAARTAAALLQDLPDLPRETVDEVFNGSTNQKTLERESPSTEFVGFKTASRKSIKISEAAQNRAAALLTELPDLPLHDKIKTKDKIAHTNLNLDNVKNHVEKNTPFMGFKTASAKAINISDEAQKKAQSLLASLPEIPTKENDCINSRGKAINGYCDNKNDSDTEHNSSPGKHLQMGNKRKSGEANICDENTPHAKIVCHTKKIENDIVLRADLESGIAKGSSQCKVTPLSECTSKFPSKTLSRQFSLSLTRRRKGRRSCDIPESEVSNETNKRAVDRQDALNLMRCMDKTTANNNNNNLFLDTPNSKDFFRTMSSTSTPHQKTNRVHDPLITTSANKNANNSMESGLTRIQWDNEHEVSKNNDTIKSLSKVSESSKPPPPSPQERIDRLCQFEPAPTLSPIIMRSNVARSVGLSRQRRRSVRLKPTAQP